jgi:hypothetical protein
MHNVLSMHRFSHDSAHCFIGPHLSVEAGAAHLARAVVFLWQSAVLLRDVRLLVLVQLERQDPPDEAHRREAVSLFHLQLGFPLQELAQESPRQSPQRLPVKPALRYLPFYWAVDHNICRVKYSPLLTNTLPLLSYQALVCLTY